MKYTLILILTLTAPTTCFGQASYWAGGDFYPDKTPFFRIPIGTKAFFLARFEWGAGSDAGYPPVITPIFSSDTSAVIIDSVLYQDGFPDHNLEAGIDIISFFIKSDSTKCFDGMDPGIIASYDTGYDPNGNGIVPFGPPYSVQGVFYDPNLIGKIFSPDSLYFGAISSNSSATVRLNLVNDSLAQYRQIKVVSIDEPFSMDDTIEMMYSCEMNDSPNCYFQPTKPGHYVDTAKLLDPLTNDTISVVLIGDAYDAGVSDVPAPQVKLYPNPCDRELQIESLTDESAEIEIYNLFGECVYRSTPQDNNAAIDCSDLPAGVYFVSIGGMASHLTQKLIVAH